MAKDQKYVFHADKPPEKSSGNKTVFRAGGDAAHKPSKTVHTREKKQKPQREKAEREVRIPGEKPAGKRNLPVILLAVAVILAALAMIMWAVHSGQKIPGTELPPVSGPSENTVPRRLVSLSPMITGAVLSLPEHEALCAVTEYCDIRDLDLATVGTPLLPKTEVIAALQADYVLCQTPLTDRVQKQLEAAGAKVIQLPTPQNLEELREWYGELGALLAGDESGRAVGFGVVDRLISTLNTLKVRTGQSATALLLPDLSGLAATADTMEWQLLGQAFRHPLPDAVNWLADAESLTDKDPANDMQQILDADPDLLMVPQGTDPEELTQKLGELRAVQSGQVLYYDRYTLETLSPTLILRLVEGAQMVYPQLMNTK